MARVPSDERLQRLRGWRNKERDLSLGFLKKKVQRDFGRPVKQLMAIVPVWERCIPAELLEHTRLESLNRGVLKVTVSDSTKLFMLDRLLREGLQAQLQRELGAGVVRKVDLRVGKVI